MSDLGRTGVSDWPRLIVKQQRAADDEGLLEETARGLLGRAAAEVCEERDCAAPATTLIEWGFVCDRHLGELDALARHVPYCWAVVRGGRWVGMSSIIVPLIDPLTGVPEVCPRPGDEDEPVASSRSGR